MTPPKSLRSLDLNLLLSLDALPESCAGARSADGGGRSHTAYRA